MNPADTNENTTTNESTNETAAENTVPTEAAPAEAAAPEVKNPCLREISVEIPVDVIAEETEDIVEGIQHHARIPGFRKGKVPASIVKTKFAEEIRKQLAESLFPQYINMELANQNLVPVSQPRVFDLHFHDGEPIRFKAAFEILPEINLEGYGEVKAEKPEVTVTDEEVEETLTRLREDGATYTSVEEDRPLQDGDYAVAGFSGSSDEEGATPAEVNEVMVEIGGAATIKEFTENLRGAKVGEQREFDVIYGEDYPDQRLVGKTIHYSVKVNGIKNKAVPELNDEFAKQLGQDFNSLDELRTRVRSGIQAEKEHQAEHTAKNKLVETLVNKYEFDVPMSFVEQQINTRLERGLRALAAQGMREEDLKKMDFRRLRDGQRDAAKSEVKASLILSRIAELEKIEVSDEEVEREIQGIAMQARQPVETVRTRLTQDGAVDRIRERIRADKALDHLYSRS